MEQKGFYKANPVPSPGAGAQSSSNNSKQLQQIQPPPLSPAYHDEVKVEDVDHEEFLMEESGAEPELEIQMTTVEDPEYGSQLLEYNGQITFYETFNRQGRLHLTRENFTFYFDTASKSEPGWEYWRCCCKYCRARIVVSSQPYRLENDERPFRLGYFKNEEHNHKPGQYPSHVREQRQAARVSLVNGSPQQMVKQDLGTGLVYTPDTKYQIPVSFGGPPKGQGLSAARKRTANGGHPITTTTNTAMAAGSRGGRPSLEELCEAVDAVVNEYPDFPKNGILFRDIMPIFNRPQLLSALCHAIADKYRRKVDAVAGLEARGFLFGPIVALDLQVPFVPIRKQGKLPGATITETYLKEYGEDIFEVQTGAAVNCYKRVLVIDDLLATGGSMAAAVQLIHKAGGFVSHVFVLIELVELGGRELVEGLAEKLEVTSLLKY